MVELNSKENKKSALIAVAMMFITAGIGLITAGIPGLEWATIIGGICLVAVGVGFIVVREHYVKIPYEELIANVAEELLPIFEKKIKE